VVRGVSGEAPSAFNGPPMSVRRRCRCADAGDLELCWLGRTTPHEMQMRTSRPRINRASPPHLPPSPSVYVQRGHGRVPTAEKQRMSITRTPLGANTVEICPHLRIVRDDAGWPSHSRQAENGNSRRQDQTSSYTSSEPRSAHLYSGPRPCALEASRALDVSRRLLCLCSPIHAPCRLPSHCAPKT
jgi:hypothetical protein